MQRAQEAAHDRRIGVRITSPAESLANAISKGHLLPQVVERQGKGVAHKPGGVVAGQALQPSVGQLGVVQQPLPHLIACVWADSETSCNRVGGGSLLVTKVHYNTLPFGSFYCASAHAPQPQLDLCDPQAP